ncbi:MAG: protein kinase [Desulforhopalus sp.]|nr:protein kinase [Desulforhopalus sp.]
MNRIGRYEVIGRLGRGGMSTVYKAKAPVTGRLVALKILQPRNEIFVDLVGEARLKEIFIEEAKIMGNLSHDHVAKIIDCDEHEGQPFIVLEYFAHSIGAFIGESYRIEAPSRVISAAKTKSYLVQALKGLERLHFAGIVHRDIKPFNLMLTSDDRIKIIDFGLSRVRGEEKMAIPGIQVGSPYYAAPEQEKNPKQADGRADLFSLGVMGYRMLTGHLVDSRQGGVLPPSSLNPEIGPEWDECIMKTLARNPAQRYASALEMRLAVEALPLAAPQRCGDSDIRRSRDLWIVRGEMRREPGRVMYKDIREALGLDELLRPLRYAVQEFEVVGPLVAFEKNSGLHWQRRGAGFTLDWQQAKEYVSHLNDINWQGRNSWRLPTLEEVLTILNPPLHGVSCSSWPLLDDTIHWLWTSDHCTKKQTWMVDVVESFFDRLDRDGVASVCAVSSAE